MDSVTNDVSARLDRVRAALEAKPDGVVEEIAATAGATPADVLSVLPDGAAILVPAEQFADIWTVLGLWGDVLMIVHTPDIVFEVVGSLPAGSEGRGWFNIHGDSPIGGHIRKDNCSSIAFVDRMFHGRRSCSVWFMNQDGGAMFKIFVRRDAARELLPEQLSAFTALRDSLAAH